MNVLPGGRLQGIGTVGTTTNAGVIAPGNSNSTLTIAGNYTGAGGVLEIQSVLGGDASTSGRCHWRHSRHNRCARRQPRRHRRTDD